MITSPARTTCLIIVNKALISMPHVACFYKIVFEITYSSRLNSQNFVGEMWFEFW